MDIKDEVERRAMPTAEGVYGDGGGLTLALVDEFASVDESTALLRMVLMRAVVETESDRGVLSWIDGDEMVVGHCYDLFGEIVPAGTRWRLDGQPVSEDDLAARRVLAVTAAVAGDPVAVIRVNRRRAQPFSREDRRRLELVARAAAQPLHAARLRDQLLNALAELSDYTERSEALERVKTDILRLASHELRTPLTVLHGYLSLIAEGFFGPVPEPLGGVMNILQRRTADMNSLVNDLLVAARVEEADDHLSAAPVDLRSVVADAVATVAPRATSAHSLHSEVPDQPVVAQVDAERVTLALRNILDNAVKYSPQGGEVSCVLRVEPGTAIIRVADHGLGIAPQDRAKLFTRFGRILTTDNSHIPGIGLGLYFTREVARRHGGEVALVADEGDGTVFELCLPLAD